jgi:hypothetical protein
VSVHFRLHFYRILIFAEFDIYVLIYEISVLTIYNAELCHAELLPVLVVIVV